MLFQIDTPVLHYAKHQREREMFNCFKLWIRNNRRSGWIEARRITLPISPAASELTYWSPQEMISNPAKNNLTGIYIRCFLSLFYMELNILISLQFKRIALLCMPFYWLGWKVLLLFINVCKLNCIISHVIGRSWLLIADQFHCVVCLEHYIWFYSFKDCYIKFSWL